MCREKLPLLWLRGERTKSWGRGEKIKEVAVGRTEQLLAFPFWARMKTNDSRRAAESEQAFGRWSSQEWRAPEETKAILIGHWITIWLLHTENSEVMLSVPKGQLQSSSWRFTGLYLVHCCLFSTFITEIYSLVQQNCCFGDLNNRREMKIIDKWDPEVVLVCSSHEGVQVVFRIMHVLFAEMTRSTELLHEWNYVVNVD